MNYLPQSPTARHEGVGKPLAGSGVLHVMQLGGDDLSEWVELMEAVEALCPVWPAGEEQMTKQDEFKL